MHEDILFAGPEGISSAFTLDEENAVKAVRDADSLGTILLNERVANGLSKSELARRMNVRTTYPFEIVDYESNTRLPYATTLYIHLEALGMDIHNPRTHAILEKAEEERSARKQEVGAKESADIQPGDVESDHREPVTQEGGITVYQGEEFIVDSTGGDDDFAFDAGIIEEDVDAPDTSQSDIPALRRDGFDDIS